MKAKKVLSGALAAILLTLIPGVAVCAEEMAGQEQTENTQVLSAQEQENQEKAASYAEKIDTNEISNWPQGPAIYAASGIVMDMNSGAVLYAKKAEEKRYPASITKVLSVLTALQYAKMSDTVVFSEDSISFLQWDDAQIGMKPGEEINIESALYGMLLASANEVSYAVAENVGKQYLNGGYAEFIEEMNRISQELGCTSSNWVNANGLYDDNHYTTAHDMARIAAAAYQNEEFRRLETTLEYKVPPTNLTAEERILDQNHKMLWPENYYYYANAKAGKTGYTDQSKTTLVTMAEGNDMQLAAVVLHTYGVDAYMDTRSMYDYAFTNFERLNLRECETSSDIESFDKEDACVVVPKGVSFSELEKEYVLNEKEGVRQAAVEYFYQGQPVGSAKATLTEEAFSALTGSDKKIKIESVKQEKKAEKSEQTEQKKLSKLTVVLALAVILPLGYIILVVILYKLNMRWRNRKK